MTLNNVSTLKIFISMNGLTNKKARSNFIYFFNRSCCWLLRVLGLNSSQNITSPFDEIL